jgi:hypothetical protein
MLDTKAMLEDLPNILQSHALNLRVAEVHCDPTEEADRCIETPKAPEGVVFSIRVRNVQATMMLEAQHEQVNIVVLGTVSLSGLGRGRIGD